MPKISYTEQFVADASQIRLASKRAEVKKSIDLLSELPELGSRNLAEYIVRAYGTGVRKLVVKPFDVIYEYDEGDDEVRVLALLHQRAAW